jgi:hypothetical protein
MHGLDSLQRLDRRGNYMAQKKRTTSEPSQPPQLVESREEAKKRLQNLERYKQSGRRIILDGYFHNWI